MPDSTKEWFGSWFETPWYSELYDHRSEKEAIAAINLLCSRTPLPPGSKVLDLACGTGRHAKNIAAMGYKTIGLDYSHSFIAQAERENIFPELLSYRRHDMRRPFPDAPFDCIVNFFTSFGYFDSPREDLAVLNNVFAALMPNGYFFFDFFNSNYIRTNLVPENTVQLSEAAVVQRRRIRGHTITKYIEVIPRGDGVSQHFTERVRLYSCDELIELHTRAGLVPLEILGNYNGDKFDSRASPRTIIISKRLS